MTTAPQHVATRSRRLSSTNTVLILLCVMYAITYIDRVNVSTAASVFKKDLHLTNAQVGLVFSAFAYPYLILQIIGGWISDRFGARLTLTVSAIIWATATLFTGLVGSLATMLVARVSDVDPRANVAYLERAILEPITERGAYVVAKPGPPTTYGIQLDADVTLVARARAAQVRAELTAGDRRQVVTLEVLDQHDLLLFLAGELAHDDRHLFQSRALGRLEI